jgi:hypothetical protein
VAMHAGTAMHTMIRSILMVPSLLIFRERNR